MQAAEASLPKMAHPDGKDSKFKPWYDREGKEAESLNRKSSQIYFRLSENEAG
jgi:hypothetical protein